MLKLAGGQIDIFRIKSFSITVASEVFCSGNSSVIGIGMIGYGYFNYQRGYYFIIKLMVLLTPPTFMLYQS